jgi:transposase
MEVLHPHCVGLDVHKDSVVACVRHMTESDVKREVRSFKTTTKSLLALSEWLSVEGCTHIVMEATGVYWKPVWHILSDGEFALVLANAAHVKNVPGRKTDVNDALWLAELLAHGLVRGSFVPDEQTQEIPTPGLRRGRLCCAPASSSCASAAAISSGCRRRWRTPTSSSTPSSPTSWAYPVVG